MKPHVFLVSVIARLAAADSRMKEEMAGFLLEISTKQQQLAAVEERQRAAEQQRQVRLRCVLKSAACGRSFSTVSAVAAA